MARRRNKKSQKLSASATDPRIAAQSSPSNMARMSRIGPDEDESNYNGPDEDSEQLAEEDEKALYPTGEDGDDYTENADGSVTFHDLNETAKRNEEFYGNLFEEIKEKDPQWLTSTASRYMDFYEEDKKTNQKFDEKYEKGLARAAIGEKAPGGADFAGASTVSHPLLMEASVEFASSCYKELWPADGPAKTKILGKYGPKDISRGDRQRDFLNYQLTVEMEEAEEVFDEMISQVPLAGSQYIKLYYDIDLKRPAMEYLPADKLLLPYSASSLRSARRYAHLYSMTHDEWQEMVDSGEFVDNVFVAGSSEPDATKTEKKIEQIQGKDPSGTNEDNIKEFCDYYCLLDPFKEGRLSPFIITLDLERHDIIRIRRNWEEQDDTKRKRMDNIVEFPFVRFRGSRSLGLMHLIGDLGAAATGSLRALLDSAFVNNQSTALIIKGNGLGGQTTQVNAIGIQEIKAAPNIDDIRKQVMPFPYNPPSPVLFQLLGFLVNAGKGVVQTSSNAIADASNTMPVGTTMALIEQGGKNFSAIHKRLHNAMKQLLFVLYRLNRLYLQEDRQVDDLNKMIIKPNDFRGPMNIIPVSDPNIFSDTQRYAQIQACWQLYPMCSDLLQKRELLERTLRLLKVPDPEALLPKDKKPEDLNPVAENMSMAMGSPVGVFPQQDHLAHLQSHAAFAEDEFFQELYGVPMMAGMVEHMKQHIIMLYGKTVYDIASQAAGTPIDKLMHKDPETRNEFDRTMAVTSLQAQDEIDKALKGIKPIVTQLKQKLQAMQPPPPMDPTQAAMADVQRQQAADQANAQIKQAEIQQKQQKDMQASQMDQQRQQTEAMEKAEKLRLEKRRLDREEQAAADKRQLDEAQMQLDFTAEQNRLASEEMRNSDDNRTALTIAGIKAIETKSNNESSERIAKDKNRVGNLKSGKSVTNPNP